MAAALAAEGVVFDRNRKGLPGRPDFVVESARLAVFVHGCYWHLCRLHYKAPAGEAWRVKMDQNRRRDIRVRRQLRRLGWRTMVVWEHDDPARAAARVRRRAEGGGGHGTSASGDRSGTERGSGAAE